MELRGELRVARPVEEVRAVLTDVRRLAACVPGLTGLASVAGDRFVADMVLDLPLLRLPARVDGEVRHAEDGMQVQFRGRSGTPGGAFDASVAMHWRGVEGQTQIAYRMSVHLRGRLALVGDAVVRAASPAKAREFEQRLREALGPPEPCDRAPLG